MAGALSKTEKERKFQMQSFTHVIHSVESQSAAPKKKKKKKKRKKKKNLY